MSSSLTGPPGGLSLRAAGRFGPPAHAWYPVSREGAVRRRLTVVALGETLTLVRGARGALSLDRAEGWAIQVRLGLVWVRRCGGAEAATPPLIDDEAGVSTLPMIACSEIELKTDYDQAVLGLVDPAHVPMIHTAWWWRSSDRRRVKTKHYAPSPFGFTATAADRFASAPAYRLVGSEREVTIEFRLPSMRVERVQSGGFRLVNLTTVTPTAPGHVVLRNVIYSSSRPMRLLYPVLSLLGRAFLEQDARILRLIDADASTRQPLLFVGSPDQPSAWYFQCKMALSRASLQAGAFINPVRAGVLRWRT